MTDHVRNRHLLHTTLIIRCFVTEYVPKKATLLADQYIIDGDFSSKEDSGTVACVVTINCFSKTQSACFCFEATPADNTFW